ncbi:MAG TPA: lysozyme inhibitor LprI family protein [Pseudolabrys sp.]|nr:lysozyme inhibitor LprI family protein [Pseudolabrys sp.]
MIPWVLVLTLFVTTPALAQDKPSAKDSAAVEKCIKAKTGRHWAWEQCIGIISEPCTKDDGMPDREVIVCEDRERAVWDDILNKSYQALTKALDEEQKVKLREMQRAWIASRDKSCGFLYDYFQGTMANPMIAACTARETARRALYLRGFADDIADRK